MGLFQFMDAKSEPKVTEKSTSSEPQDDSELDMTGWWRRGRVGCSLFANTISCSPAWRPIESNIDPNPNQVVQFFSSYLHLDHRTYHQNQQDTHLLRDGTSPKPEKKSRCSSRTRFSFSRSITENFPPWLSSAARLSAAAVPRSVCGHP